MYQIKLECFFLNQDTYVYQQYEISDDDRMVTRGHPIIITPVQTQIVAKGDVPNATRNHLDSVIGIQVVSHHPAPSEFS